MFGSVVFLNLTLAESFFDGPWHSLTSGRASQTLLRASKAYVARPLVRECCLLSLWFHRSQVVRGDNKMYSLSVRNVHLLALLLN